MIKKTGQPLRNWRVTCKRTLLRRISNSLHLRTTQQTMKLKKKQKAGLRFVEAPTRFHHLHLKIEKKTWEGNVNSKPYQFLMNFKLLLQSLGNSMINSRRSFIMLKGIKIVQSNETWMITKIAVKTSKLNEQCSQCYSWREKISIWGYKQSLKHIACNVLRQFIVLST